MSLHFAVNWNWGWGNSPNFEVYGESEDSVDWKTIRHEYRDNCWRGQSGYQVHYLAHDGGPQNNGGFSGAHFDILDSEGKPITLRGPWSGSACWCNKRFPDRDACIEVTLNSRYRCTGNFTEAKIIELWREARGLVKQNSQGKPWNEWEVRPLRLARAKLSWRESISLIPLMPDGRPKANEGDLKEEIKLDA